MLPTSTKKRGSLDTDSMRGVSSPGTEHQSKRAKVESFQLLGRNQDYSEYHEPLRDPNACSPGPRKGHKRASSTKLISSPSKAVPSYFPSRAQSVPLGGENEVRTIDLTSIPPSPRRSLSKGSVEIRRAPSVPPPDEERMDIDDASGPIEFTNATHIVTPRANPAFRFTVNFATPLASTPARSGLALASPLSPLTPLPPSPPADFLPGTQSLLAEKVNAKLLAAVPVPAVTTSAIAETSSTVAAIPSPSTTPAFKLRPPKSTGPLASKSKSQLTARKSASLPKPPPNNKKQTSLDQFINPKPPTAGGTAAGDSAVFSSMAIGGSLRPVPPSSPSKIPLPASPSKRPWTPQQRATKSFHSSLGATSTGVETGTSRAMSGRSLLILSQALDKLAAPPPSRPNTSMGFVRGDGTSNDEDNSLINKGKGTVKDDSSLPLASIAQGQRTTFARPTASSLKRVATVTGFGSTTTTRMRGRGAVVGGVSGRGRGTGIFGRTGDRASKKTSLPVVVGSPVKGSREKDDLDAEDRQVGKHKSASGLGDAKIAGGVACDEDVFMSHDSAAGDGAKQDVVIQDIQPESSIGGGSTTSRKLSPPAAANGVEIDLTVSPVLADKGKQRGVPPSALNPASSALQALSDSLSSLPRTPTPTPPKPRAVGTRTGLRSSTAAAKESPVLGVGNCGVHGSGGTGPSNETVNGSGGAKKPTFKVLKQCVIFVDVRTEQGDDAGSVFIEMLKGLGAKIMSRIGSRCTHIVYKNGHPNTLTRYRLLNDPKPFVIGIAWVVDCVEKRAKVDEERFKVDVDVINVAGGDYKRRRSKIPKHWIPTSPSPDSDMPVHIPLKADETDGGVGVGGSPSQDPDLSIRSKEDDLTPLERARRRRSVLQGGQTRLFP